MGGFGPTARRRSALAATIPVLVALGLLTRSALPMPAPVAAYGGDTLYATLIYVLLAFLWPHAPLGRLGLLALGFCVMIELSQLVHAPWLDALRRTLAGRLVLGAGFRWDDLVCYALGALLGAASDWGTLTVLRRWQRAPRQP